MQCIGASQVPGQSRFHHSRHLARLEVGHHRNHALAPDQHRRHGGEIIAGQDNEVLRAELDQFTDLIEAAAGFLDANDIRQFGQSGNRGGQHVGDGPPGHVIEHQRDVHRFQDGFEMLVQPFLARLVVIWHHREHGVGAAGFGRLG